MSESVSLPPDKISPPPPLKKKQIGLTALFIEDRFRESGHDEIWNENEVLGGVEVLHDRTGK